MLFHANEWLFNLLLFCIVLYVGSGEFAGSAWYDQEREENPTPDDDVFRHLATVYAKNHATMWMGKPCKPKSESFVGGIVNGAKWYVLIGQFRVPFR